MIEVEPVMEGGDYTGVIRITFGDTQFAYGAIPDDKPDRWRDSVRLPEQTARELLGKLGDALEVLADPKVNPPGRPPA